MQMHAGEHAGPQEPVRVLHDDADLGRARRLVHDAAHALDAPGEDPPRIGRHLDMRENRPFGLLPQQAGQLPLVQARPDPHLGGVAEQEKLLSRLDQSAQAEVALEDRPVERSLHREGASQGAVRVQFRDLLRRQAAGKETFPGRLARRRRLVAGRLGLEQVLSRADLLLVEIALALEQCPPRASARPARSGRRISLRRTRGCPR